MELKITSILLILAIVAVYAKNEQRIITKNKDKGKGKPANLPDKKSSEKDRKVGNNVLRVDNKGGKMVIARRGQVFSMKIKEIVEAYSNKTEVSKMPLKDVDFNITNDKNDTRYGIQAAFVEMKGMLPNQATVTLKMFMFTEAGNVTGEDGNIYSVVDGGVKLNLEIDWPTTAKKIFLTIQLQCGDKKEKKGKKAKKAKKSSGRKGPNAKSQRNPKTLAICPKAQITLSPAYNSDGTYKDMTEDYPESNAASDNGQTPITLEFSGKKIFYDPVMETGDDIDAADVGSGSLCLKCSNTWFMVVASILFSFFKMF